MWIRSVWLKVQAGGDLTITPYLDGRAFPAYTHVIGADLGADTIVQIPVGRGYCGRLPRLLITSGSTFYPFWVEFQIRDTGKGAQKRPIRVPLLEQAAA